VTAILLGAIVSLAATAATWMAASLLVAAAWPPLRGLVEHLSAGVRAQVLAGLRLFPAAMGCVALPVVFVSFVSFEPAQTSEVSGVVLIAAALGCCTVMVMGLMRAARGWRATNEALSLWTTPQPVIHGDMPIMTIDEPFPVVAVVGIRRPRLYIARQVLASCDQDEFEAMIAHEKAHVAARDNLTRLLFLCAVPMRGLSRSAAEIETSWTKATEEAADDLACRDEGSALALASALLKVSRLAAGQRAPLLHASAILSGAVIEHRVRRLLLPRRPARVTRVFPVLVAAALVLTTAIMLPPSRRAVYHAAEFCVQYLP
jgi:Zn-dependent protease with chaperone function